MAELTEKELKVKALRDEIRKGILGETFESIKDKVPGEGDAVDVLKVLVDQGFRCYNTEDGAMLSMLSTFLHLVKSGKMPADTATLVEVMGESGRDTVANRALVVSACGADADTDYLETVMNNWLKSKEIARSKSLVEENARLRSRLEDAEKRIKELEESVDEKATVLFKDLLKKYGISNK